MRIIERARALALPLQINTTVSRQTVADLPALAGQMEELGVVLWALFFLIPVGRAQADQALSPAEIEAVLEWTADLAARAPFGVKTTDAPHFHRVLAVRGRSRAPGSTDRARPDFIGRAGRAVTDGNGFLFIDHLGQICPGGFLPLPEGNVRRDRLVTVYQEHPLFVALRDPARLGGRCGRCEYRERYGIEVRGGTVAVTMTLTAPDCPIHEVMPQWIREAVGRIPGVERVEITLTFEPPGTPDRISLRP